MSTAVSVDSGDDEQYATDDESLFIEGERSLIARNHPKHNDVSPDEDAMTSEKERPAGSSAAVATSASRKKETETKHKSSTKKKRTSKKKGDPEAPPPVAPTEKALPVEDDEPTLSKEEVYVQKRRHIWICIAVFITLCAVAVGACVYFFFINEETPTVAKLIDSKFGSGESEPLSKKEKPEGSEEALDDETGSPSPSPSPSPPPLEQTQGTDDPTTEETSTETPESAGPSANPSTAVPTASPTAMAPTSAPTTEQSLRIRPALIFVIHDVQTLLDEKTPQRIAFDWLRSKNTLPLETDSKIVQRYALVTTALALQSQLHSENGDILFPSTIDPATDECSWEGIVCGYRNETAIFEYWGNPIGNLTNDVTEEVVVSLNWARRELGGTIPDDIGLLTSLKTLDLAENAIQGPMPEGLYDLKQLEYLYLHENQLSGSISGNIMNLQNLNKLLLADNKLTGSFPQELGSISSGGSSVRPLTWLSLYNNQFSGSIPQNLNLRNLHYLDLGHNAFTGSIPNDWVDGNDSFSSLRVLYLDYNRFDGPLPEEWASLGNGRMKAIVLSNNTFTGEVPSNYKNVNTINIFDIQNNEFDSFNKNLCNMIVFVEGEMTSLRADCNICRCNYFCGDGECY